jgi:hypothetical protein
MYEKQKQEKQAHPEEIGMHTLLSAVMWNGYSLEPAGHFLKLPQLWILI